MTRELLTCRAGDLITAGCGSQLSRYVRRSGEYGGGHVVIPLASGMLGDGYGRPVWAGHVYEADMTRWHYDPLANVWRQF